LVESRSPSLRTGIRRGMRLARFLGVRLETLTMLVRFLVFLI
jgi:hypothetical protein